MKFTLITFITTLLYSFVADARIWTSADGTKTFSGEFLSFSPPIVEIKKINGKSIKIEVDKLSETDRRYCSIAQQVMNKSINSEDFNVIQVLDKGLFVIRDTWRAEVRGIYDIFMPANQPASLQNSRMLRDALDKAREWRKENPVQEPTWFIWGNFKVTVAEGDEYDEQKLYWAGSFRYTTTGGLQKSVQSFTLTFDEAVARLDNQLYPPNK